MRRILAVCLLFTGCPIGYSQAAPSANRGVANLRYSFRYSEMADFGGNLGTWHTITPSGSLDYDNGRKRFPFSLEYVGGYTSALSGPSYTAGLFQRLFLLQGMSFGKSTISLSDDVSYRPESPTTGFSGIPGIGEPIGTGTNTPPSQLILTVNSHALENAVHGGFRRILSPRSILNVEAAHDFLHFPDNNGIDTRSFTTSAGITIRLDPRNRITTQYGFSQYGYSGYDLQVKSNLVTLGLDKSWTRSLRTSLAAGLEWINSSKVSVPSSVGPALQTGLDYQKRRTTIAFSYSHETSAGSGYMLGSKFDDVSGNVSTEFNRALRFEMNGGYRHTSQLGHTWNISGAYGGVQASWQISRHFETFVNYTATSQSSSVQGISNVLNEMMHTLGCGIGFTKGNKPIR
jgi:hypothetical protein